MSLLLLFVLLFVLLLFEVVVVVVMLVVGGGTEHTLRPNCHGWCKCMIDFMHLIPRVCVCSPHLTLMHGQFSFIDLRSSEYTIEGLRSKLKKTLRHHCILVIEDAVCEVIGYQLVNVTL